MGGQANGKMGRDRERDSERDRDRDLMWVYVGRFGNLVERQERGRWVEGRRVNEEWKEEEREGRRVGEKKRDKAKERELERG